MPLGFSKMVACPLREALFRFDESCRVLLPLGPEPGVLESGLGLIIDILAKDVERPRRLDLP